MINIVCLDISEIQADGYRRLYSQASPERQNRADRYLRWEDKVRCVAADALTRYAVAQALGISEFTLEQEAFGKPRLLGREDFHFNLSHSGHWVVIAYGGSPVGIDVQQIQMDAKKDAIARQFFAPEEQEYIFQCPQQDRAERFFQVWTAKESYLKYTGKGLCQPLNSFCVVPDGSRLGVRLHSVSLENHCLTLCTTEEHSRITHLNAQQLIQKTEPPCGQ